MTTYFTSDTHFDHANIIKYCNRPFKNVDEMNEAMVEGWNRVVTPQDTVYHLGDFTLGNTKHFWKWVNRLNGAQIYVLPGSHDQLWTKDFPDSYHGVCVHLAEPLVSLEFPEILSITGRPQVLVLCHYAMRVWDRSHFGAWHLYGHSHGTLLGFGLSFDIGVDSNGFAPVSLEEVALRMGGLKGEGLVK
jgi:calcineurin-like phosphoesterase family protein